MAIEMIFDLNSIEINKETLHIDDVVAAMLNGKHSYIKQFKQ